MTLEEAKAEASRRWTALGGWAEEEYLDFGGEGNRWERRVGYRTNDGNGSRQVQMGAGKTWEKAFQSADKHEKTLEKRFEQHYGRPRHGDRAVEQGGFPTVEMEFDQEVS